MVADDIPSLHGLARALAELDLPAIHQCWQHSLSRTGPFRFFDLPLELKLPILKLATTKSSTYAALMQTCRDLADLARIECVPDKVILSDRHSAISFYACLSVHPEVGAGIKQLWYIPALPLEQEMDVGAVILRACTQLQRLACHPDILVNLCMNPTFMHLSLVDVTLMDPIIPWHRLIGTRHGTSQLFKQLQTFRLIGGIRPAIPPYGTSFPALTTLSLTANTTSCVSPVLLNHAAFPQLANVIVTVPYTEWRMHGMGFLMTTPEMKTDTRLVVVHCPNSKTGKWKEIEVWKGRAESIWNSGVAECNSMNVEGRQWK